MNPPHVLCCWIFVYVDNNSYIDRMCMIYKVPKYNPNNLNIGLLCFRDISKFN